jgi:tRNA(Ile)-lysidine synthase
MLLAFENYVKKNRLFSREDKLLLAVSGGEDSVCLFHLLVKSSYKFSVAHLIFQLRGKESMKDEEFVRKLAKTHNIPFFSTRFETEKKAEKLKLGIQETARKLRYEWFHELLETYRFSKLLTAHHLGDNSETMIINLLRSTGISGLHGIPVNHGKIARPMMFADRNRISSFMTRNKFRYRLDKSNLSDHYLRNAIRHHVMPALKKLEPGLDEALFSVSTQVLEFEEMARELLQRQWDTIVKRDGNSIRLPFGPLNEIKNLTPFLYYALRDYGFNKAQISSLGETADSQVGKKIESPGWELIRERDAYCLVKKQPEEKEDFKDVATTTKSLEFQGLEFSFKKLDPEKVDYKMPGTVFLDISSNPFPLRIRTWKKGDRMQPLGMKGSKKISDILTDRKIDNSARKKQVVVLDRDGNIAALLPGTISETYKIRKGTRKILSVHCKTP